MLEANERYRRAYYKFNLARDPSIKTGAIQTVQSIVRKDQRAPRFSLIAPKFSRFRGSTRLLAVIYLRVYAQILSNRGAVGLRN